LNQEGIPTRTGKPWDLLRDCVTARALEKALPECGGIEYLDVVNFPPLYLMDQLLSMTRAKDAMEESM
jgi:hypothetical protein